jgi:hypothetical protein
MSERVIELDNFSSAGYIFILNTPSSFGERARSRFERSGFCFLGGDSI